LISIVPAASLVTIPEMSEHFGGVASQASLPTMFEKKPMPGEFSLKSRMIVFLKSLALIGWPFEYFSPLRTVNLYSLPPFVTVPVVVAIPGSILAQLSVGQLTRALKTRPM
jgi:hypothetical protein